MNGVAAGGFAVAGALASIPVIALAFAIPARGRIQMPQRWWLGTPASPAMVALLSLLTGAAAGVVTLRLPLSPTLPTFWVFVIIGVGLAIIDIRRHRLPHPLTGALWLTCGLGFAVESLAIGQFRAFVVAVSAGLIVGGAALVIALALPGQLGLGDVSLAGAIAMSLAWLNLHAVAVGLAVGITIQAAVALAIALRNRAKAGQLPLGPAMLLGWLIAILCGTG